VTADTAVRQASVGTSLRRKEDSRLVTGRTTWTDNINLPGLLYMAIGLRRMAM
jgi:carbon-monoxide dehydrogenase large subunit